MHSIYARFLFSRCLCLFITHTLVSCTNNFIFRNAILHAKFHGIRYAILNVFAQFFILAFESFIVCQPAINTRLNYVYFIFDNKKQRRNSEKSLPKRSNQMQSKSVNKFAFLLSSHSLYRSFYWVILKVHWYLCFCVWCYVQKKMLWGTSKQN